MRSWRESLAACVLVLAGCTTEVTTPAPPANTSAEEESEPIPVDPDACETSFLTYDNFGEPYMLDWCRGCHSSSVPAGMRQKAPASVNFDTLTDVRDFSDRIAARAASFNPTMPPAGGPSEEERTLLAEWLACGAP